MSTYDSSVSAVYNTIVFDFGTTNHSGSDKSESRFVGYI